MLEDGHECKLPVLTFSGAVLTPDYLPSCVASQRSLVLHACWAARGLALSAADSCRAESIALTDIVSTPKSATIT